MDYVQPGEQEKSVPEPAKPALAPEDIQTIEELYITGLHIEQYRHATYNPLDYYLEALKRSPSDVRSNNAIGLLLLKSAKFDDAIGYFKQAIATLTKYNPNPYDGEPYFNLGITLRSIDNDNQAYDAFFKATWNAAWQDAAYFNLTQIDLKRGNFANALKLVDQSLIRNWHNHKARHLKVLILRKMGQKEKAENLIKDSLAIDHFNFGILFEKWLLNNDKHDKTNLKVIIRDYVHNYIEYALDYAHAGQFIEAIELLYLHLEDKSSGYPMVYYCIGFFFYKLDNKEQAKRWFEKAATMPSDYCFPNRLEEVIILKVALEVNPKDQNGWYYLGNFWMARKQYSDARSCWERALAIHDESPLVLRNLSLLYYNKLNKKDEAVTLCERAFSLNNYNSRILMELDQLYKKINKSPKLRLKFLEDNLFLVLERDDLYLEYVTLLNIQKRHMEALTLIKERKFHPWEGGEGKVPAQYILANIELAKSAICEEKFEAALEYLNDAQNYPDNLGEGKLFGAQENDVFYWLGCVYDNLNDKVKARDFWIKASQGLKDPSPVMFYNDQSPDKIFYQGLALLKLGEKTEAEKRFKNLINYGEKHRYDKIKIDYFAVSLPDLLIWDEDLNVRNQIHCQYMIELGKSGLRDYKLTKYPSI